MWYVYEIEQDDNLAKELRYYPFLICHFLFLRPRRDKDGEIRLAELSFSCKVKAVWECEDRQDAYEWLRYLKRVRNENK